MSIFNRFKQLSTQQQPQVEDLFKQFLNNYNCKFSIDQNEGEDYHRYFFDYQGGHYIAIFYDNIQGVEIIFPRFLDTTPDNINVLRSLSNRANSFNIRYKFHYSIDEKDNSATMNLSFFLTVINHAELKSMLEHCFVEQREFNDAFSRALKDAKDADSDDFETDVKNKMREKFLLRQQEFLAQHHDLQFRTDQLQTLTLSQILMRLEDAQSLQFTAMHIIKNGQMESIDGSDNIANYDLSSAIIEGDNFSADHAVAVIRYNKISAFDNDDTVHQDLISTITFKRDDTDGTTLYYRLQVTLDDDQPLTSVAAPRSVNKTNSFTLLVAHDLSNPKKKLQEFDYMWKDAQIKLRDKQMDELTDEQKLILNIDIPNVSYCVYWGMKYYRQQRFYEALHFLEAAYEPWRKSFFIMKEDEKSAFFDVCYHIGFCYCELQLYKQAFYYLDIVGDIGRIDFAVEHVNALANAGDVRIFHTINNILHDIQEQYNLNDEEEDVPDNICRLVSFLKRRNAFSLIEFGKLDDAETEFKKLLNDPASRDYAIQELAYIQRLRNNSGNHDNGNEQQHEPNSEAQNTL
ncbi:MAG: hypothetical protein J5523_05625 [Muribaculaceae bacterium]|nr:hypothetical protein [Muribaculaceae bacterium]